MRNTVIQLAKSGIVGRTSQRPVGGTGESTGIIGESLLGVAFGFTVCRCQPLSSQWLSASLAQRSRKRWEKGPTGKASGLTWTHEMLCVAHIIQRLEYPGKCGPHGELFFFLIEKEPFALTMAVQFKPFVPAETLKACALIGLHLVAAGGESGSSSSCGVFSQKLGGMPGLSGPGYPLWKEKKYIAREVRVH